MVWQHATHPGHVGYFIIYFVLGFIVLASLIAAIGSPCNSLKEAQNAMSLVSIIMVIPMMAWMPLSQDPNGFLATSLSFIPPLTPMVMIVRVVASPDVPGHQIILSILWLALSAIAFMWAAGKIFRIGVLMYGKPASLRELARWIWAKN